jgi:hypothetical protein
MPCRPGARTGRWAVTALTERLRDIRDRVLGSRGSDGRDAKLERAEKKAVAEAQRREYQRQNVRHRK